MTGYNFPPDPWLAPPAERTCERCRRVLVGEDERGPYYQVPVSDPAIGLTFMDRVHTCGGEPHQMPGAAP